MKDRRRIIRGAGNLALLTWRRHRWRLYRLRPSPGGPIPIDRPIFLLGVQGGGLTLLSRMLRRNPQVVSVTGDHHYWAGPDEMQNVLGPILPSELTGLHHKLPHHPRYPKRVWLYAIDELLPLYRRSSSDARPAAARRFQEAIRLPLRMYGRHLDAPRFLDKSQTYTVRLPLIDQLLSGCRPFFILVTRNPYAVCYRAATRVKSLLTLDLPLEKRLEIAAQHWTNSFEVALKPGPHAERLTVIRFEDLLQEPEKQLSALCRFVQLDLNPNMIPGPDQAIPLGSTGSSRGDQKWYPLRPDVNRRYLEQLEPWMVEVIADRAGPLAQMWHYTPEGP